MQNTQNFSYMIITFLFYIFLIITIIIILIITLRYTYIETKEENLFKQSFSSIFSYSLNIFLYFVSPLGIFSATGPRCTTTINIIIT